VRPLSRPSHWRALLLICGIAACAGACSDDLKDPLIEALLPTRGAPGALVDVVGERFTLTRGLVHFGGRPAKVLIWTPQRARVQVPDAGLFGLTLVVLTAEGRPSNAVAFFVEGDPRPDAGVPDMGPIPDLPWVDGPLMDGPLMDGPLVDAAPDAGADAGGDLGTPDLFPDLPLSDVWTPDAVTDLATSDAAALDAAPDATPDAATPDAATPDAATPDAAATDAPAPDAAAPDAGGDL
jgi:IPT/TIG domain